jgi:signal transduction histidine kinase
METPPLTLLAVEDDQPIVELLSTLVAPLGVELVAATTGAQALALLETLHPAVVTLDLVLPDTDGYTVLEHVRSRRELEDVPVLALTALSDTYAMKRAYALGAADFIVKPFNVDLLDAKLRVFLRLRRLAEEVRERERFLVEVVEHLSSGLAVCDADGRVVRLNAAGAAQLGLTDAEQALGRPLAEVARGADILLTLDPSATQRRATVMTPLGERQLGFTTGALDGGGVVIVFRELSVAETARRDAEMRQRFEALWRAARGFAHEVRNPLAAMSAAAQVLLRDDVAPAMRDRLSHAIDGEAQRVAGLVLEYVETQTPPKPSREVHLRPLLEEIVEVNLLALAARSRVALRCPRELPAVRADAARIKQVVLNLVLNAIAATEGGGAVTIAAVPERRGVSLTVSDTGCGIPPEHLPRIFDESFSTRPGGHGLGLHIARRIIEDHGGALRVESTLGEGTVFTVWLRAYQAGGPETGTFIISQG